MVLHMPLNHDFLFQDMGTMVLGKVESGVITKGQSLTLMPNKVSSMPDYTRQLIKKPKCTLFRHKGVK